MNINEFLKSYFSEFHTVVENHEIYNLLTQIRDELIRIKETGKKILLAGNGASASIASHFALDFTKQAKVRAMAFNDASLITAFSNDYGYADWAKMALYHYANDGDIAILISSSGQSPNIINAASQAREMGIKIITFTGFDNNNPLKQLGDINLWVDSRAYNIIESVHSFWLSAACDLLIGKSEYSVSG